MPGASGGPCFDIDWRLLALHQGSALEHENLNYGLGFGAIRDWLIKVGHWDEASRVPPIARALRVHAVAPFQPTSFALDPELRDHLFAVGESEQLELKRHAVERMPDGQPRLVNGKPQLANRLVKSVAAFLNARAGGTLLVGLSDAREFLGVEEEYALTNRQRANADAYTLWLGNKLREALRGTTPMEFISFAIYREEGRDICAIRVRPADSPVFVDNALYVRRQNENIQYHAHDMIAYVGSRWKLR